MSDPGRHFALRPLLLAAGVGGAPAALPPGPVVILAGPVLSTCDLRRRRTSRPAACSSWRVAEPPGRCPRALRSRVPRRGVRVELRRRITVDRASVSVSLARRRRRPSCSSHHDRGELFRGVSAAWSGHGRRGPAAGVSPPATPSSSTGLVLAGPSRRATQHRPGRRGRPRHRQRRPDTTRPRRRQLGYVVLRAWRLAITAPAIPRHAATDQLGDPFISAATPGR